MRKKVLIAGTIFAAALTLGLGTLSASAGGGLKAPETGLTIAGKKPALFSHPTHLNLGLECGACHHDGEHKPLTAEAIAALPDAKGLGCVSCHNSTFSSAELQKPKDVFHARCQKCHQAGYKGKSGPTACTDCHLKKVEKAVEGC